MTKIAVVTGSSYGLGNEMSKQLLAKQFKVYGISRTQSSIKSPQFIWLKADLTNLLDIKVIAKQIKETKIDVLVNNAGTAFEKLALDFTDEDFEKMFNLNFKSPIRLTKALFPKLLNGLIINISSLSDRYPDPLYGLYGSSKAALNIYFETIAAENKDVKVVNVLPSYINTPLQHKVRGGHKEFDWNITMQSNQVAEVIPKIIANDKKIDSGTRIIVISDTLASEVKNPEKLMVFNINNKKLNKAK